MVALGAVLVVPAEPRLTPAPTPYRNSSTLRGSIDVTRNSTASPTHPLRPGVSSAPSDSILNWYGFASGIVHGWRIAPYPGFLRTTYWSGGKFQVPAPLHGDPLPRTSRALGNSSSASGRRRTRSSLTYPSHGRLPPAVSAHFTTRRGPGTIRPCQNAPPDRPTHARFTPHCVVRLSAVLFNPRPHLYGPGGRPIRTSSQPHLTADEVTRYGRSQPRLRVFEIPNRPIRRTVRSLAVLLGSRLVGPVLHGALTGRLTGWSRSWWSVRFMFGQGRRGVPNTARRDLPVVSRSASGCGCRAHAYRRLIWFGSPPRRCRIT